MSYARSMQTFFKKHSALSYLQFQTRLLQLVEKYHGEKFLLKELYKKLISDRYVFEFDQQQSLLQIDWPRADGVKKIIVQAAEAENVLHFFDDKVEFLTLSIDDEALIASIHSDKWDQRTIYEIVDHFNQIFQAEIQYVGICQNIKMDEINTHHRYSKEQFDAFVKEANINSMTTRINDVIVKHSLHRGNKYYFHLNWVDAQNEQHELQIQFVRGELFQAKSKEDPASGYSWVVTENALLNQFPEYAPYQIKEGQLYYSLKVSEIDEKDKSAREGVNDIFDVWMTPDGNYGELHNLHKRKSLSGNDILEIYKYFDKFFCIKNTFICDASLLATEEDVIIPMRLISALATGKTWYESKLPGVKLFDCHQFPSAHNGMITQNASAREKALKELQELTIVKWRDMLSPKERAWLAELYGEYDRHQNTNKRMLRSTMKKEVTLKSLVTFIYQDSKTKKSITPELKKLVTLLCDSLDLEYNNKVLDPQVTDYWVKSRVNTLLWDSFFWLKKREDENLVENGHNACRK